MGLQKVLIARHGERIDHVDRSWKKSAELPHDPFLTERGLSQAQSLAERLKDENISHIFVSPFLRCIETANKVAELLDLPLKVEHGACEYLNRAWFEEMPKLHDRETLEKRFPRLDRTYKSYHSMSFPETVDDVRDRCSRTIDHLVRSYGQDGNILVVSHGLGVEMLAVGLVPKARIRWVTYCSLVECLKSSTGVYSIGANADTSFLEQPQTPNSSADTTSNLVNHG
mmetsp:Transcript_11529/g.35253  ORF Transcript_11529/g.35253 Transcript_11529/m.35253 type:complete len:227 (+) Transcript_11529:89-769(+)